MADNLNMKRKAVVVGAGPVGCLTAAGLAKLGWSVDIYEARPDIRLPSSKAAAQQRSINLAISSRGIAALRTVLDEAATARFLETVIPMRGRMIHHTDGTQESQAYDRHGQCINSIDRALLNESILNETLGVANVRAFFRHKVASIDFEERSMVVTNAEDGQDRKIWFGLCIGADGSYSVVRRQMMRVVRMNFQQEYIPHEYVELKMPPGRHADGTPAFLLDPNHLHIWPRHSFMLIALPNKDHTFTCTLFAPTTEFNYLTSISRSDKLAWFNRYFPDAVPLIGQEQLLDDLERHPRSPLISIKANPYHYKDRAIVLGDAAHSMVPFYGQGLNCGLEDVRVLYNLLRTKTNTRELQQDSDHSQLREGGPAPRTGSSSDVDPVLASVLEEYSKTRHEDLVAICDLAMDNYVEMRHSVTTLGYQFRKRLDNFLSAVSSDTPSFIVASPDKAYSPQLETLSFTPHPRGWLPLYTMVTFRPDISYATAKKKAETQGKLLSFAGSALTLGGAMALVAGAISVGKYLRCAS
ncbi:FAD/NAD(P)-binding domain-containing protein [Punctularia strigosozonata HHB-11173 SS5]|uniref:FAD/NAD(P)-binding domain-containing protein n=1 Tax=Punctularia strigosozonata (strain HHB-11173) TaxID=741275 RepID=UPI0004417137|nr:FAD/NAD(P)-binding domain-containing protein [Punctularia strigosozonata HHB-11173 SS5]EIN07461.1 FAD/NAD(P)-binding domain-containing protein [Punctularia strigosozonata HHB-11173 SS5]